MGNICQFLIKFMLDIFIEKYYSKFPSHLLKEDRSLGIDGGRVVSTTLLKSRKNWVIFIGDNACLWKRHSQDRVFLDSNLNFTIRVFPWGLTNDLHVCKKYEKPAKHHSV